jgi:hypothetical protein
MSATGARVRAGLPTPAGLCYKLRAVRITEDKAPLATVLVGETVLAIETEYALSFCPVCSEKLTARKCKLICTVCGYYMSCSDYY